ncbi:alkyl hydroperoxide reductase subunit F [Gracilibacillus salinarum]|uniref:Alkyl hydroperoxide reductase subunit F n=1 Tax=Gracilibacillus salinarum TaxID=2932255 RepID=A0ABY4GJR5_9BACI|nr:alkyl hydroperoxide reductase subunit F [Gracilibacillus salinarum]UOQ84435.1 alkyl hydroperoxide reductase subunit F [Gracilibacillus salinarum]
MLDQEIKSQLNEYLKLLENNIVIKASIGSDDVSKEVEELVNEIAGMSDKITVENSDFPRTPSFSINREGEDTGVVFAGVPLGHEFTSLVLALLQVSGRPPKVDEKVIAQIQQLNGPLHFETFVSLSCQNCPDVVQALNVMSVVHPDITHTMIEGSAFKEEADGRDVMAVPAVFLDGESFVNGRQTLESILERLGSSVDTTELNEKDPFDVLVVGGGPAGSSAAIYAARKGIRTGIVAERFGGQVQDTLGIENFITTTYTEGPKLVANMEEHVREYEVDIMNSMRAKSLTKNDLFELELENGATLKSKTVVISTGARWRNIGVPGEAEYKNKGVAYCPHCDGPIFAGKDVAVIGGGNSGVEAAIDLAGIVNHVTVIEYAAELKADSVLQDRLKSLPNVTVLTNAKTEEIYGSDKVEGLRYLDLDSGDAKEITLAGVFVQIGLVPNTEWLQGTVEMNKFGEIIVDSHGTSSIPGVFAAGDCTNSAYKQIIISMGSGATASLGAFDHLIRN